MSAFIKYMAKPRLNYIELVGISTAVGLLRAEHYVSTLIVILIVSVLSVGAESHAERGSRP